MAKITSAPSRIIRDGEGLKRVSYDEYSDAFSRGEPTFVAYKPLADGEEPFDVGTWQEIGYTTDVPEAFRRQP